tara:strand:+ start:845 stop:1201 length:357 start_codon:yes stop_codon:yes gene_type:complete
MSVKLCLMKTGDYVISDVNEILSNKEKVCGYMLKHPHTVTYSDSSLLLVEQEMGSGVESTEREIQVTLSPWIPLTSDNSVPVTLDSVIALVNPLQSLQDLFDEKIRVTKQNVDGEENE